MNLATLLNGAAIAKIPAGAVRVHRIATAEEIAEDDDTPAKCASCGVPNPRDEYYTRPSGKPFKVCKECVVKSQLRRDKARRSKQ